MISVMNLNRGRQEVAYFGGAAVLDRLLPSLSGLTLPKSPTDSVTEAEDEFLMELLEALTTDEEM